MKILNAFVDDPTLEGYTERPVLVVETDSMPDVTIEPEAFPGGWMVGKFGPFVRYSTDKFMGEHAGEYNVRFSKIFPPVVDVVLKVDGLPEVEHYSLPVTRARQLIRKHDPKWRLLLSDKSAQNGVMEWLPVEINAGCRRWIVNETCGKKPTNSVRIEGVDFPLCEDHMKEHNHLHAVKRAS